MQIRGIFYKRKKLTRVWRQAAHQSHGMPSQQLAHVRLSPPLSPQAVLSSLPANSQAPTTVAAALAAGARRGLSCCPPLATALRGVPGAVVPVWCAAALPSHEFWVWQRCLESDSQTWALHKKLQRSWAEGSRFRLRETSPWLSSMRGLEEGRRQLRQF